MHSNVLDCVLRVLQGIVTVVLPVLTLLVTIVLAAITYWYAQHTKDMAQSTAKQVETARKTAQGDMLLRLNENSMPTREPPTRSGSSMPSKRLKQEGAVGHRKVA